MEDYEKSFFKKNESLDKVYPYLNSEYRSILKLSSYVEGYLKKDKHEKAQKLKEDMGLQYGRDGRRLCNLYLRGYITEMIDFYLDKIFELSSDKEEIGVRLNKLVSQIIKFSDYVFFINPGHKMTDIVEAVVRGMLLGKPYIALHSAGSQNIKKTEEILKKLNEEKCFEEHNYELSQEHPKSSSICPLFNVYITPKNISSFQKP